MTDRTHPLAGIPVADRDTAAMYAFDGAGTLGEPPEPLEAAHQLAVFEPSGGSIVISVPSDAAVPLDSIVLAGGPINEPMARYGPVVMNTAAEIDEAIAGRMGSIPASAAA